MSRLFRRLLLLGMAVGACLTASLPSAQAATYEGDVTGPYNDWLGVDTLANLGLGHVGITNTAFLAACTADLQKGGDDLTKQLIASPLNGVDAFVIDLGKEMSGPFSVTGPGQADQVGPPLFDPTGIVLSDPIQLKRYDLDLDFFADVSTGCGDANFAAQNDDPCYATSEAADESTPCIHGYEDAEFKKHGARFVIVSAALNLTGGPLHFKLTTP